MEEMELTGDPAMQKLLQASVFYKTMTEFLYALELGVESDLKRCGSKKYASDAVTVMTLHGSKGLEFPVHLSTEWRKARSRWRMRNIRQIKRKSAVCSM